ncbi:DNA replication/repair protein RecF [Actinotalea ferrariae]|uniref:DNA replication/repair protein RecF n=1 Tax=Actinotalea ferrariae TaxID=1386098 RepID=UPI001C8BA2FA|nr:DNA replication/repair protein RecF [Actinotalea ferrariae]MBX9245412.1 DNA replication/repair protein RecF [Actinotalea ferrariae]
MHVSRLSLTDFRSYEQVDLELEPGVTALVGPNGQGKTNLVEAIGYVATLGSHRVATDAALIRAGAPRAVVRLRAVRGDRQSLVELEINPGRANRAQLNRAPVRRARDVLGVLRTVLFAPEDLALVKGDPDGRRRFLDELMVQVSPRMAGVQADYDRVLRQRGALLKTAGAARRGRRYRASGAAEADGDGGGDLRTLDVWDSKLAQIGAQLLAQRVRLVEQLRPHVAAAYDQVSAGQGEAVLGYRSSLLQTAPDDDLGRPGTSRAAAGGPPGNLATVAAVPHLDAGPDLLEAQLLEAMSRMRGQEIDRGVNLVGPHRDDLVLTLGGLPAKGYASHGESWSFALALRLASFELLTHGSPDDDLAPGISGWGEGAEPVLILDDVFAELDARRRDRLAGLVARAEQVIVTAAVAEDVPEQLEGARVDVMAGQVTRVR